MKVSITVVTLFLAFIAQANAGKVEYPVSEVFGPICYLAKWKNTQENNIIDIRNACGVNIDEVKNEVLKNCNQCEILDEKIYHDGCNFQFLAKDSAGHIYSGNGSTFEDAEKDLINQLNRNLWVQQGVQRTCARPK
jgi:hypothetical protein